MDNVITIFLIILAEVALVEAIAIFIMFKRRKGTSSVVNPDEARNAFKVIKGNVAHTEALTELLKSTYHVEEEKLQDTLDAILGAEYSVYSTALKGVATGNCKAIISTQAKVSDLQDQYHSLVRILHEQSDEKTALLESNNKDLQFDIDRLSQELKTTLSTMESTLSEYANMYAAHAATAEGDENLTKLNDSVDNAKQHATHTINKAEEDAEGKRVPISEADIVEREKAIKDKETEVIKPELKPEPEPKAESEPESQTIVQADAKTDASDNSPPIAFETMGDMQEKSEPKIEHNQATDIAVDLNIDGDIDIQLKTPEVSSIESESESDSDDIASEEEITSFMLDNGSDIDSVLMIDPEVDADIADLLNDANDISLSEDIGEFSESTDLDSQLNSNSVLNEAKTATK